MIGMLLIPRGLPASGKTSWARKFVDDTPGAAVRLNRDDIRAMMLPSDYRQPVFHLEELVSKVQHGPIADLLRAGVDVIVDDTNLRVKNVRALAQLAAKVGARWRCMDQFLEVPLQVCLERDAARDRPVGEAVIRGMHQNFLSGGRTLPVPVLEEAPVGRMYEPLAGAPEAVLCDLDGTVALHEGVRGPYDTSRYHLDRPNVPVIEAVRMESAAGRVILFCSGRDREFEIPTIKWLGEHVLTEQMEWNLFMRPAGDRRNDAVVKLELFDKYIRDKYRVLRCYDDRDRVVSAYRSIGLTVLQVAPGNF